MQGRTARHLERRFGWLLALALAVPGACGGDLLINYDNDGESGGTSATAGGEGGATGEAGGAGEPGNGGGGAPSGTGGDDGVASGGTHIGTSGGKGGKGGMGQGGASTGGSGAGGTGGTGETGGTGGTGGTSPDCGNGTIDDGEDCDDGNVKSGDGCSSECTDSCELCMAANCAPDPLDLCYKMPGESTLGPGAGVEKALLCAEMVSCVHESECFTDSEVPCFCGDKQGTACFTMPNGPCVSQFLRAMETTDGGAISSVGDIVHPAGPAHFLVGCTWSLCQSECYSSTE